MHTVFAFLCITAWKPSQFEVLPVRIFTHSDWIRRDTKYFLAFSPNERKYRPEKHQIQKIVTQHIFLLQSSQAVEWRVEKHQLCGSCCSSTISADELFLEQTASTTICSWTVRYVTGLIVFHHFRPVVTTMCKQQCCW